ncbi:MAG: hypothetical protein P8X39_05545, partial [Desulfofustis sp.]
PPPAYPKASYFQAWLMRVPNRMKAARVIRASFQYGTKVSEQDHLWILIRDDFQPNMWDLIKIIFDKYN